MADGVTGPRPLVNPPPINNKSVISEGKCGFCRRPQSERVARTLPATGVKTPASTDQTSLDFLEPSEG
ncbi:hypothetical protein Pmani_032216 [Petrolisthes manimaculis]|uniref:Uncharacterized protein n=1 Tax=Petrolisthes manimaculis TaxID=1843537 RepID=A0AAE1TR84_9EUCA|nr:hypothetical protein Pmani_032216 [Petrolisthes manimaculis]